MGDTFFCQITLRCKLISECLIKGSTASIVLQSHYLHQRAGMWRRGEGLERWKHTHTHTWHNDSDSAHNVHKGRDAWDMILDIKSNLQPSVWCIYWRIKSWKKNLLDKPNSDTGRVLAPDMFWHWLGAFHLPSITLCYGMSWPSVHPTSPAWVHCWEWFQARQRHVVNPSMKL